MCGKTARRALSGGRLERGVPTGTFMALVHNPTGGRCSRRTTPAQVVAQLIFSLVDAFALTILVFFRKGFGERFYTVFKFGLGPARGASPRGGNEAGTDEPVRCPDMKKAARD